VFDLRRRRIRRLRRRLRRRRPPPEFEFEFNPDEALTLAGNVAPNLTAVLLSQIAFRVVEMSVPPPREAILRRK
jgi:hypothetical protein